jgi:hypothetical protein
MGTVYAEIALKNAGDKVRVQGLAIEGSRGAAPTATRC